MQFRAEGLELLIEMLEKDYFDEQLFDEFTSCEQFDTFMLHEKELLRKTTKDSIRANLIAVLEGKDTKECYQFDYILKYKDIIKGKLNELKNNASEIEQLILKRIDRYAPLDLFNDNFTIHLYGGSWDYGFSIKTSESYINLSSLAGQLEFLEDIISHEYYHSRKRLGEVPEYDFSREEYLRTIMYNIMEEGTATLVQFEYEKKYEGFSFISKERFDKKFEYIRNLDTCIRQCELENNYSEQIVMEYFKDSVPNYIVGYWIGQVLFKEGGKKGLELWTCSCDYIGCFKQFINILRRDGTYSGFSREVEDFILGL
ncbi:DUF5700 domain-containing putative Zn-dependent protease [Clostridium sp. C8-1-8]|uniref:DUF5700 domain-containing putative Zn-dependent protease n=1 Tax=Clostridium sp. C8-1-8 TaxID=2698831 RepID=UPI00136C56D9|nr:DUF5700 domain-containing putative Zn-dependent protease [Clostridium sp. C8-1-8]